MTIRRFHRALSHLADTLYLLAYIAASAAKAAFINLRPISPRGLILDAIGILTLALIWIITWKLL